MEIIECINQEASIKNISEVLFGFNYLYQKQIRQKLTHIKKCSYQIPDW